MSTRFSSCGSCRSAEHYSSAEGGVGSPLARANNEKQNGHVNGLVSVTDHNSDDADIWKQLSALSNSFTAETSKLFVRILERSERQLRES